MDERPPQPPEGKLIADALKASGLSIREASRRARLSYGRWRQITAGYQNVSPGSYARVHAPPDTLARMAREVAVTPAQLEAAGRPDAAGELEVILASPPPPVLAAVPDLPAGPGDDLDRVVDEMIGGQEDEKVREALRALWRMALPPQERLAMLRMTLDFAAGRRPPPQDPPGQHSAGPASLPSVKISNDPVKAGSPS